MNPDFDQARFRDAMRLTASGVSVMTTDGPAGRAGITVSSLCSLSLEPPSVLVCIHGRNTGLATLLANGVFVANVLAEGQEAIADTFAGLVAEHREDRFAAGEWGALSTGSPVLAGSLCSFDCRVASVFEFGSHKIIAGEVVAVTTASGTPLVYSDRAYRRLLAA